MSYVEADVSVERVLSASPEEAAALENDLRAAMLGLLSEERAVEGLHAALRERGFDRAETTVRHHLDVLLENNVVRTAREDYGTVYLFTDQLEHNWETVRRRSPPPGGRCTTSPRTRRPVT
jgi:DNA-binding transcriptional ArsR family regulator